MWVKSTSLPLAFLLALGAAGCDGEEEAPQGLSPMEQLGKKLYFDENLSSPKGQSCASCHDSAAGFADPDDDKPCSEGATKGLFGNRNSPSAAYAAFSPDFHYDATEGLYVGGQFWDGRAKDLVEQAKGPFLNPLEMGMADEAAVVAEVRKAEYASLFKEVFGASSLDDAKSAYDKVAQAIAAFEKSDEVNPFNSKYDLYLAGEVQLTAQEKRGLELFEDEKKGNCAACHPSQSTKDQPKPLFTDFTYDNLGTPKNKNNPFYTLDAKHNPDGAGWIDKGLGGELKKASEDGKHKVPTLRNIARTAPYMHNGVFKTLKQVVDFYNKRDVGTFDPAEVADNVNSDELGDLGLTDAEVADIVAFLETLTDGYQAK
jgi:cytochrome c peroxidase